MKLLSTLLPLVVSLAASAAADYSPFLVKPLYASEPNGNPDGQVDYYHFQFNVTSLNGGNSSGYCWTFWGDNGWGGNEVPYSLYVPTGSWIDCEEGPYKFQLYPYFSIGNFTFAVQETFTDASGTEIIANGSLHVTNSTSQFTCDILPSQVEYEQHAHGDCSIPANGTAFSVPVTGASPAQVCSPGDDVNATFAVTSGSITTDETILLVGNITQLGGWDPSSAVPLSSSDDDGSTASPMFYASVEIPSGTSFEYKYIVRNTTDGSEEWECCENRTFTIAEDACGDTAAGNDPDYFRFGGSAVTK